MPSGPVKWFDEKKGFGFIVGPEGHDVFVHFSVIEGEGYRTLEDGETVEYEIIKGNKGLSAANVRRTRIPSANQVAGVAAGAVANAAAGASAGAMAGAPVALKAM